MSQYQPPAQFGQSSAAPHGGAGQGPGAPQHEGARPQPQPGQQGPGGQHPQGGAPGQQPQFGASSGAPAQQPQYGGASAAQQPPQAFAGGSGAPGQQQGAAPQQPPAGYPGGYPQGGYGGPPQSQSQPQRPAEPGLFDLTFAKPIAPRIAKLGLICLWVVAGAIAVSGLTTFIWVASQPSIPGAGGGMFFVSALFDFLVTLAIAFGIVVLGRIAIESALAVIDSKKAADGES